MNRKFLTLAVIVPLAAAGALSTAPFASAAKVAPARANPTITGFCTFGSHITLNATHIPIATIHVDVRIHDISFFPAKQTWNVSVRQTTFPPQFQPTFTAIKQTNSFGSLRVQTLTEPIGFGINFFRASAHNLSTGEVCITPQVPAL
jgi:hypothetical protein